MSNYINLLVLFQNENIFFEDFRLRDKYILSFQRTK